MAEGGFGGGEDGESRENKGEQPPLHDVIKSLPIPHPEVRLHGGCMVDGVQQLVPQNGLLSVLGQAAYSKADGEEGIS